MRIKVNEMTGYIISKPLEFTGEPEIGQTNISVWIFSVYSVLSVISFPYFPFFFLFRGSRAFETPLNKKNGNEYEKEVENDHGKHGTHGTRNGCP